MKAVNIFFVVIMGFLILFTTISYAQVIGNSEEIGFNITLQTIDLPEMPAVHSYAYGIHENDILIIGGRIDGLHSRQPFAAFPLASNNQQLIVVNPVDRQVWTATLNSFPISIKEQFQATNMNFYQSADTLYLIGGYAYSPSANNHITFPNLTTIIVSELISSIKDGDPDIESVRQISDERFANTGGQMGMLDETLLLIGGNKFTGRYNPVGNPTYTQTYSSSIQYFKINNSGIDPVITSYSKLTDADHLRRRDYNLLPYIFTDGRPGYLISAGVFRQDVLLPYLYPVEIDESGFVPHPETEQFLSHYHSPKLSILDTDQKLHMIFFGGLAQYYFRDNTLIQDNNVPFVKTISRFTRNSDGTFTEYLMPLEMPELTSTNAEFIPNKQLSRTETGVFILDDIDFDNNTSLGYIIGGIHSDEINPFSLNRTQFTSASSKVYQVVLNRTLDTSIKIEIPYKLELNQNYPNPFNPSTTISFVLPNDMQVQLEVFDVVGNHIQTLVDGRFASGIHNVNFDATNLSSGIYFYRINTPESMITKIMLLVK